MNERLKELALQVDLMRYPSDEINIRIQKFAELVRADEREACAKLVEADGLARGKEGLVFIKAAARIRARGEK